MVYPDGTVAALEEVVGNHRGLGAEFKLQADFGEIGVQQNPPSPNRLR